MPGLAVHLETHLKDRPFGERWRTGKALGFAACEFVWRGKDMAEAAALRSETGMAVTCMGGTTGGAPGHGRPALVAPQDREQLASDLDAAVAAAHAVDCPFLVMVPGDHVEGWSEAEHHAVVVASLRAVVPQLEAAGVTALLEPLNTRVNHPTCWCDTSTKAFAVVEAVGSRSVRVLYDLYHMKVMGDDLQAVVRAHHPLIGYYHVAGVPGRHEPTGGEVDFRPVLDTIEATGYRGFVGLEYSPSIAPEDSLRLVRGAFPDPAS